MQTILYIIAAVSVVLNVVLLMRSRYFKTGLIETNERLVVTYELLWAEAEKRGATDKNIFTGKLIALSQVHPQMRPDLAEKWEVLPKHKAQGGIGFH